MKKRWITPAIIERVDRRTYITLPLKPLGSLNSVSLCRPRIKNPLKIKE